VSVNFLILGLAQQGSREGAEKIPAVKVGIFFSTMDGFRAIGSTEKVNFDAPIGKRA